MKVNVAIIVFIFIESFLFFNNIILVLLKIQLVYN